MPPRTSTRGSASTSSSTLIAFYDGSGTDFRGRTLSEILQWDARKLEAHHDYIQTLFPLPEGSDFNENASLINSQVFKAFRDRRDLRDNMEEAFKKMLWFYGLEHQVDKDGDIEVIKGYNYDDRAPKSWNKASDHNHKRISRVIRCLRLLGLEELALAFYDALLEYNSGIIKKSSLEFWRRAAERALNIRPDIDVDDEEDDSIGPRFLRDFVRSQKGEESDEEGKDKDFGALSYYEFQSPTDNGNLGT